MDGPAYALLDRNGALYGLVPTLGDALAAAQEIDPSGQIYLDAPTEQDVLSIDVGEQLEHGLGMAANPRKRKLRVVQSRSNAPLVALNAFKNALARARDIDWEEIPSPPIDYSRAIAMSLADAHGRLRPFFPAFKYHGRKKVKIGAYDTPRGMADVLLGQNYKTEKDTPPSIVATLEEMTGFRKANVLGLSLLPHTQSYTNEMVREIVADMTRRYGVKRVDPVRLLACVKATPECASSCLAFSGRNLADDYNTVKKYALLQALVYEPEAFARMLAETVSLHRERSFKTNTMPLVRLNVFSDLPWERMVPGLFEQYSDVQFYDYTKVPSRKPPENYDLTFSFAGTQDNVADMDWEIRKQGRRVAVVFAAVGVQWRWPGKEPIPIKPRYQRGLSPGGRPVYKAAKLPPEFLGLEVIDGDESDMRPYDPAPSIVGLRWKTPANQNVTLEQANVFIVLVDLVHAGGGHYHCIVSKTARFDDVDYAKYAASKTDR